MKPQQVLLTMRRGVTLFTYLSIVASVSSRANAVTYSLVGVELENDRLIAIDSETAEATVVGPVGFAGVTSLAYDASTNTTFGFDTDTDQLFSIDPFTGAATVVGPSTQVGGLAINQLTGTLYGISSGPGLAIGADLYEIDKTTGASTLIGTSDLSQTLSLASDPFTGELYSAAIVDGERQLITIDAASGAGEVVGPVGIGGVIGLDFDPATGMLFGIGNNLITIDPTTGAGSLVGPIGFQFVNSLVFVPAIPEPSSAVLVFVVSGVLMIAGRTCNQLSYGGVHRRG